MINPVINETWLPTLLRSTWGYNSGHSLLISISFYKDQRDRKGDLSRIVFCNLY